MQYSSQNKTKIFISAWILLSAVTFIFFQNCSKVAVDDINQKNTSSSAAALSTPELVPPDQTAAPTPPSTVVCDPLSAGPSTAANGGLKGSLYYRPDPNLTNTSFNYIRDYLELGTKSSQELYLSQLNVPTRRFTEGFSQRDGTLIKKDNGEVLIEYFALHLESVLKLQAKDAAGKYQLALLSDDGSILKINTVAGASQITLINNDNAHSAKLGCANNLISMDEKTRLSISIDYFQGPREHIALMALWRPLPADTVDAPAESLCGRGGTSPGLFFDSNTIPSTPQQAYEDLLSHGWKPIEAGNFELPNKATNPCH